MDNDEKLTSHHEDALPGDDADAKTPPEDGAGELPMPPFEAAEEVGQRSNTISFPRSAHVGAAGRIEANFGMPDFDFPEPPRGAAPYESAPAYDSPDPYDSDAAYENGEDHDDGVSESESETASEVDEPGGEVDEPSDEDLPARASAEMPLDEGTGWDSVGRIERPASLVRARPERAEPAFEPPAPPHAERAYEPPPPPRAEPAYEAAPPQRSEANVMPFPGAAMHRTPEPVPSEMLRGMGESPRSEIFARSEDAAEAQPDFDGGGGDALADAVQSALRNVYGGQSADRGEEPIDPGSYTVAESLMHASSERAVPEDWHQERSEDFYQSADVSPAGEANTEAVLDYLYGQRRGDRAPQTGLSADSSLRDFGEASGYSQDWQDGPQFEERFAAQGALRDFGDTPYRNAQQRFADPGDRIYLRDSEPPYRGETAEEAEWAQVPYLSHPGAVSSPAYSPPMPSLPQDTLSSGSPDSSHLLGAAGLGLIGGIALAGVLAVFAFNSIYDEGAQKVVGRLESPAADTGPAEIARAAQPAATAPASRQAAVQPEPEAEPEPELPPAAAPRPVPQPVPAARLSAQNASGVAGDSIALDINVADSADRDETLVSLKGLPAAAKLSTGIDVGGGQWLLPPARLANLTVALPRGATGDYDLEVQLLQDDAQTSLSDPVPFQLTVNERAQQGGSSGGVTRSTPVAAAANADQAARLAVLPDETPQIETDFVTQMLIRDGNRLMRDGDIASARKLYEQAAATGNAEAALAMGRSYDPSYFEKLQVKSGKPDPATAFEWYKRALEGGLVTARVKIDALKQWLQR